MSLDKNAVQNAALGKRSTVCALPCLWLQETQLCDEVPNISMLRVNMYTSHQHCLMPFHFRYRNNTLPGTFVTTMRTYACPSGLDVGTHASLAFRAHPHEPGHTPGCSTLSGPTAGFDSRPMHDRHPKLSVDALQCLLNMCCGTDQVVRILQDRLQICKYPGRRPDQIN